MPVSLRDYRPARFTTFGVHVNSIVARSIQGSFHICAWNVTLYPPDTSIQNSQPPDVTCSSDGGATWHAWPMPFPATPQNDAPGDAILAGITNEGALLAFGSGTLYRIAATSDADRWQPLGAPPLLFVIYCPSPGAGILWAVGPSAGNPVGPLGSTSIFTVNYSP